MCNNTAYWGKILHYFEEIHSTHQYCIDLLAKNKPKEGTVIMADYQSKGRGQGANPWKSEAGKNLLFSTILYPINLSIVDTFFIPVFCSLAIVDFLAKYDIVAWVKWPNDIYVGNRKIAGILFQTTINRQLIKQLVVSIGLNVNQIDWPRSNIYATSMRLETAKSYLISALRNELFINLEHYYEVLKREKKNGLLSAYNEKLLWKNELVQFSDNGKEAIYILKRIDSEGNLYFLDKKSELIKKTFLQVKGLRSYKNTYD